MLLHLHLFIIPIPNHAPIILLSSGSLPHSSRISGALVNPASMTHKLFQCLCDRDWQPTDRLWHISHTPIPTYTDTHTSDQDDSSSQRKPNPHLPEEPDADPASCCKLKGMAPTSSCLNLHHWGSSPWSHLEVASVNQLGDPF